MKPIPSLTVASAILSVSQLMLATAFPDPSLDEHDAASKKETAVLAGGCFWGVEAVFNHVKGVTGVVSGYSGGDKNSAHAELVEAGRTGHAESVKLTYDPSKITYGQILKVFFSVAHNPTELNRQGPDVGPQYRSVIFYLNDEQKRIAEAYLKELDAAAIFPQKIVTELTEFKAFYPAEKFLQHYSEQHPSEPYVLQNDLPKLAALEREYPAIYKK